MTHFVLNLFESPHAPAKSHRRSRNHLVAPDSCSNNFMFRTSKHGLKAFLKLYYYYFCLDQERVLNMLFTYVI